MRYLTPHFTYEELTKTNTGLENTPTGLQLSRIKALARILEYVRGVFGKPIYVNSAFRSPEVNNAVGGSRNSFHLIGSAVDIPIYHYEDADKILLERALKSFYPCEFIKYDTFWHVAYDISRLGTKEGTLPTTIDSEMPEYSILITDKTDF